MENCIRPKYTGQKISHSWRHRSNTMLTPLLALITASVRRGRESTNFFRNLVMLRPAAAMGIDELPDEILLEIFSYLDLDDLAQSAYVCGRWHSLVKGRKALWKKRELTIHSTTNIGQVLKVAAVMPQLKSVRLVFGARFGIHIAWPEATVILYSGAPHAGMPRHSIFATEMLLVSRFVADEITDYIKWVNPQTLKWIHVGEQCLASITDSKSPFYSYVQHRRCILPDCLLHSKIPLSYRASGNRSNADLTANAALCPALEQVSVYCVYLSQRCLEQLCSLGPLRTLRVKCHGLQSLSFLSHCTSQLEVLSVTDCIVLPADAFVDLFASLRELKSLRVLKVSCKSVEHSEFMHYVTDLRHLEVLLQHGRDSNVPPSDGQVCT